MEYKVSIDSAKSDLEDLIRSSEAYLTSVKEHSLKVNFEDDYNKWIQNVLEHLDLIYESTNEKKLFVIRTDVEFTHLSRVKNKSLLIKCIQDGILELSNLRSKMNSIGQVDENDLLSDEIAVVIIRRILTNFYTHIQEMYVNEPHKSGCIRKADTDKIKIGNEYDVQKILISLIRPVFPDARVEVSDDTGYKSRRYDVVLDNQEIIIEVKCTRDSMSERSLTEEIGSDVYHYKSKKVFFFIYDKSNIVKNTSAFTNAYTKSNFDNGKSIETIVIQNIVL